MKKKILKRLRIAVCFFTLVCFIAFCTVSCSDQTQTDDNGSDTQSSDDTNSDIKNFSGATVTDDGYTLLNILENIDTDTLTSDGNCVYFDVYVSPDQTVRFGGVNVKIEKDSFTLEPNGMLFSLNYMGEMLSLDIATDVSPYWFEFGVVYANSSRVESLSQLRAAFASSIEVSDQTVDLSFCSGGFFSLYLKSENNSSIKIDTLSLTYDPSAEQITYSNVTSASELEILSIYSVDWETILSGNYTTEKDLYSMAETKMAESGSIESDIISGIDLSSVTKDGDTVHFTSVMSNGEKIRFEATGISIDENGMTISPGAEITSLDSLGKIYLYTVGIDGAESYADDCFFECGYGYTYSSEKISVSSAEQIHTYSSAGCRVSELIYENRISFAAIQPNFVYFCANINNSQDILLNSLKIGYDPSVKVTAISAIKLDSDFSASYLAGDMYNIALEEKTRAGESGFEFYLILQPDTEYSNIEVSPLSIHYLPDRFFTIGELKNSNGEILNKKTAHIEPGDTLDVKIGDYDLTLELDVLERYSGASTLNELLPFSTVSGIGENNTLVVPVAWADQTENATDEALSLYRTALGKVIDTSGTVTDHSDPNDTEFSLSEYFEIASYGKFEITSFLTDWYYAEENFAEMSTSAPSKDLADKIVRWVKETYPDLDWSRYDQNADGYIDSLVIINSGVLSSDEFSIDSYSGAVEYRESYFADNSGTQSDPTVNIFVTINQSFLDNGETGTLIHEFSHMLGIIDYYDVSYSGIDAVGKFDMQSANVGDWNSYSKLAVGWMDPKVVSGLSSGESVEFTIGSSALTGDVIVIPSFGTEYDGPFGEYIMIDLFSDEGVNAYDADEYGLAGVTGIRISHVDANMELRTIMAASGTYTDDIIEYTIGTVHHANDYKSSGMYNIEVIQAGGVNTFTDPEVESTSLSADDLFGAGDVFTLEDYSEFFFNGLMDNGDDFGYTVTVVSIGQDADGAPTATVRITAD